mgnify:CR=1 FL=1
MELLDKIVEVLGDEKMTLAEYQEILEAGVCGGICRYYSADGGPGTDR